MSDKTQKTPTSGETDRELENDVSRLQARWRNDDSARAEPPDLLDQAVLNAARRDLEPVRKGRPLRWIGGFATAAVVVLAFTVMLERPQPGGDVPEAPRLEKSLRKAPIAAEQQAIADSEEAAPLEELRQNALPAAPPRAMSREARRQEPLPEQAFSDAVALPTAEAWIEKMQALKRAGLDEELRAELEAFRSAYPDVPLPAELAAETP